MSDERSPDLMAVDRGIDRLHAGLEPLVRDLLREGCPPEALCASLTRLVVDIIMAVPSTAWREAAFEALLDALGVAREMAHLAAAEAAGKLTEWCKRNAAEAPRDPDGRH